MEEKILSQIEIEQIVESARINLAFQHPDIMGSGQERTSIWKISPRKGIIFIKGDPETGFTHINARHSFASENYYWKEDNNKIRLDDPSKFSKSSIPYFDYISIADELYSEVNYNTKNNKRPDDFDMYSGEVSDLTNGHMKYHMLLYKGTKIIHTLYPGKRINNRKKHINYARGKPSGRFWLEPLRSAIAIPYSNHKNEVVYSFQILKDLIKREEKWVLFNHKTQKNIILNTKTIENIIELDEELRVIEFADLSDIEQLIKRLEAKEK